MNKKNLNQNTGETPVLHYKEAGVDTAKEDLAMEGFLRLIKKTLSFRNELGATKGQTQGLPLLNINFFANVIDIGNKMGLAISTDGVGTKAIIAQKMDKYDTIGIDCIAMNVNDIICVGAEPISMLNYLAIEEPDPQFLEEIAKGLYKGAEIARITIPGGELAQIKEMLASERDNRGFDIVGMAIGFVQTDKINIGQDICEGDVIIGLKSSGIHSNGLSLARNVFFKKMNFKIDKYLDDLKRTIGEELLEPTHIYVPEIMEMVNKPEACSTIRLKALINITGNGFLNLLRVEPPVSYIIDYLPPPHPVFTLIQELGHISDEEMYKVFNMGIGFCVIVPADETERVKEIAGKYNVESHKIGHVVNDGKRKVIIEPVKLIGDGKRFSKY